MTLVILTFILTFIGLSFVLAAPAQAICPVCTIAVGAGLGISRALGVDDTVTSVWIGGMMMSLTFWTIDWLAKKEKKIPYPKLLVPLFWYGLTFAPLLYTKVIGLTHNRILGIDKIVFGTVIGTLVFLLGRYLDGLVRKKYGKQFFQFQKVVFPVSALAIASIILYFVTS
jgi:hypothetical protein